MAGYSLQDLAKAIALNGSNQYYDFGKLLGFRAAQIKVTTGPIQSDEGKVAAIIDRKKSAVGDAALKPLLIQACKDLPTPIWGDVETELTSEGLFI